MITESLLIATRTKNKRKRGANHPSLNCLLFMKKIDLDHADMVFFKFLDKFEVHFLYWAILALVIKILS